MFSHPAVEREYDYITKPNVSDEMRAFGYLRMIQRNLYIVNTLTGILEAYVGAFTARMPVIISIEPPGRQTGPRNLHK